MSRIVRRIGLISGIVAALFASAASNAQEAPWKYGAEIYLWGANVDIESFSGSDSEIRFTDIVSDLDLAGMARLACSEVSGDLARTSFIWISTTTSRRPLARALS